MKYKIEFKPRAAKDLRAIDAIDARRILTKVRAMENELAGDIKRLTNFDPNIVCESGTIVFCSILKTNL